MASKKNRKRKADCSEQEDNENKESFAKNYLRISKDNLYMIIALWMENIAEAPEHFKKVGAVLVLPNDIIYAADCSRDGVHAVQRLLMRHYDKAEGCKIFMSRKPCPTCAKLLVQAKVQRVLFLPLEPEYYPSPEKEKQVDILFTASAIAQTKVVLQIDESVLVRAKKKTLPEDANKVEDKKNALIQKYGTIGLDSTWMGNIEKELPWPGFNEMKTHFQKYFQEVMEWIARVFYIPQSQPNEARGENYDFELCEGSKSPSVDFKPCTTHKEQAKCLIEIARFLATRTDDPKVGVGAVIASPKMEILGLGWNGFPLKALYGEFARASRSDQSAVNKKYPYVIHAEQNALLMRNKKDIEGAILFVTRSPCDECTPLIKMQGIKTVVVDEDVSSREQNKAKNNQLSYEKFEGKFICYQTKKVPTGQPLSSMMMSLRSRKLQPKITG